MTKCKQDWKMKNCSLETRQSTLHDLTIKSQLSCNDETNECKKQFGMKLANQFPTREITEGSSVAKEEVSNKKRAEKVIINCVMLQIPNKICFQFSFPIHSTACVVFFLSSFSLSIQYFIFHFFRMLRGEKAEKRQPEN